jgi:general secretion pathway protein C
MVRLFGAVAVPDDTPAAPPAASERFQLVGVIAPRSGGSGMALVTIDGQPARAWRTGATLDGETTLLSVAKRTAEFGPRGGPASFTLELPEPASAETGTLPPAVSQPIGAVPTQPPQTAQQMLQQAGTTIPGAVRGGTPAAGFAGRPGMPPRPGVAQPGMISPNGVPPGRTPPTAGQQPVQPNDGAVQRDEE